MNKYQLMAGAKFYHAHFKMFLQAIWLILSGIDNKVTFLFNMRLTWKNLMSMANLNV